MKTSRLTACLSCAVLVAGLATAMTAVPATAAHARAETCQGLTPTVVGPTQGENTTGTVGDDVIVAPISSDSKVSGLGGNDTICLVDGVVASTQPHPTLGIDAGPGNDSVTNELTWEQNPSVSLGPGSDHYIGNDLTDDVTASAPGQLDTDIDVIDTRGGYDSITTGSPSGADENHDVISTGAGRDLIYYGGLAGGAIDNGDGVDVLTISSPWSGELLFDNTTRKATLAGNPGLSWTSIIGFRARVQAGSSFGFVGSDAPEAVEVSGTTPDLASDSTIAMGGGFDRVWLENYLPGRVNFGEGRSNLQIDACVRSYVDLGGEAACFTDSNELVHTKLAGVDRFWGRSAEVMNVRGTEVHESIVARARSVLVRSLGGKDTVFAEGRTVEVIGGRGSDRLVVAGVDTGIANGGAGADEIRVEGKGTGTGGTGADILRGRDGRQSLYGGRGNDVANGQGGKDLCRAEIERACEV